jgi:dTDP-glucose 4,6-dehydratase
VSSDRTGSPCALVTGGAGFLGSHLCERLLAEGYRVVCVDNLVTGTRENVVDLERDPAFEYVEHDVTLPLKVEGRLDEVYHLASPASPKDFGRIPIEILAAGSLGTHNALDLALAQEDPPARFLLASSSEVYGDPLVHPQQEDYRGNVGTTGVRSVYDEAKRYAEALTTAYHRKFGLDTRVARIFNTYGPRMRCDDGRMVPNFICRALAGEPLAVYGDGTQTRSLQYVEDLVEGVFRLMRGGEVRPVNLGNPVEYSVGEIAEMIVDLSGSRSELVYGPLPEDDPKRRRPDISRAREVLAWEPTTPAAEGLKKTIAWFQRTSVASDEGSRERGFPLSRE